MFKNILRDFRKGFTLVELLVVIGVLGVLAAGLIVVINPVDKIAQANDSKVQTDISQISSAAKRYSAQSGTWPATQGAFIPSELTVLPVAPSSYAAYTLGYSATGATFVVAGQVKSLKQIAAANAAGVTACTTYYFKYASGTTGTPIDKVGYSCNTGNTMP